MTTQEQTIAAAEITDAAQPAAIYQFFVRDAADAPWEESLQATNWDDVERCYCRIMRENSGRRSDIRLMRGGVRLSLPLVVTAYDDAADRHWWDNTAAD